MVVLVTGLPGVGKSYFSRQLANEIGARNINTDIIRKKLHKEGQYQTETNQLIYHALANAMIFLIMKGEDVVVDATFHRKVRRIFFEKLAKKCDQRVFLFEVCANDATIKNRLKTDREHSEADYAVYLKLKQQFDPVDGPHFTIWTDHTSDRKMMKSAKKYIYA